MKNCEQLKRNANIQHLMIFQTFYLITFGSLSKSTLCDYVTRLWTHMRSQIRWKLLNFLWQQNGRSISVGIISISYSIEKADTTDGR